MTGRSDRELLLREPHRHQLLDAARAAVETVPSGRSLRSWQSWLTHRASWSRLSRRTGLRLCLHERFVFSPLHGSQPLDCKHRLVHLFHSGVLLKLLLRVPAQTLQRLGHAFDGRSLSNHLRFLQLERVKQPALQHLVVPAQQRELRAAAGVLGR